MSTTRNSIHPVKATEEEAVKVLREHLEDDDAVELARRYMAADTAVGRLPDIPSMKRRLLQFKTTP